MKYDAEFLGYLTWEEYQPLASEDKPPPIAIFKITKVGHISCGMICSLEHLQGIGLNVPPHPDFETWKQRRTNEGN